MKARKGIIGFIIALLLGGGGYAAYDNAEFGSSRAADLEPLTLIGAAASMGRMPNVYVEDSSTTTDSALNGGGLTVKQDITLNGAYAVRVFMQGKGGTATSTLYIKPQLSYDGSTFFDTNTSTIGYLNNKGLVLIDPFAAGTSTPATLLTIVDAIDFGVNTTTKSRMYFTDGAKYLRLVMYGEDISTDPSDYVQAYIQAIAIN